MKAFTKFFVTGLVLIGSSSAFAQTHGVQNFCPRTGMWNYGPPCSQGVAVQQQIVTTQNQQIIPANAIRIPVGQAVPQGYCSWGGRVENIAISALLGGVIGALAGDNHRAAGKGAAAGALAGVFVPCQQQVQQVRQEVARVQEEKTEILIVRPAQVRRQITFEGGDFQCPLIYNGSAVETAEVKDETTCSAWTDAKARQKGWIKNN